MKRINKKGFTLIELLATISILAIIIVIAVPAVTNILDNIKKKSTTTAALLLYKSIDTCIQAETDFTICNKNSILSKYYEGTLDAIDVNIDENGNVTVFRYSDLSTGYAIALNKSKITKDDISNAEILNSDTVFAYNKTSDNELTINSSYDTSFKSKIEGNETGLGVIVKNLFDKNLFGSIDAFNNAYNSTYSYAYINGLKPNTEYSVKIERLNGTKHNSVAATVLISGATFNVSSGNYTVVSHSSDANGSPYTTDENGRLTIGIATSGTTQSELNTIWANTNVIIQEISDIEQINKYKIPITVSGKNMFNVKDYVISNGNLSSYSIENDIIIGKGNEGGKNAGSSGVAYLYTPVYLSPGTYTFSVNIDLLEKGIYDNTIFIYLLEDNNSNYFFNKNVPLETSNTTTFTHTFTIENQMTGRFRMSLLFNSNKLKIDLNSLQIEKNDSFTEFEAYIEPKTYNTYLDAPLKTTGTYKDYIDFETKTVIYYDSLGNPTTQNIDLPNIKVSKGTTIISWN
ncbi:MAG: prepilin-type N-terminal cleavage/methylation domain-containing protein [Bacilli bacterium]|nr:prepilin-type N-terminal cleavage/methylation domain-containing protein [Bacilli bacterium]